MTESEILQIVSGWASFGFTIAAYTLYAHAIRKGGVRPEPATWIVLSFLSFALLGNYFFANEEVEQSALFILGDVLGNAVAAYLCWRHGFQLRGWNLVLVVVALATLLIGGIASFAVEDAAATTKIALWVSVFVDFLALAPTIVKTWADPSSEPRAPWQLTAVAGLLGICAISIPWTQESALPIVYLFAINLLVLLATYKPALTRLVPRGRL